MSLSYPLDTHVLLWWFTQSSRLKGALRSLDSRFPKARRADKNRRFGSGNQRPHIGAALVGAITESALRQLSITAEHALAAGDLPCHHDDPFDRMLVAQALAEGLTLISLLRDARLRAYEVAIIEA